MATYPSEHIHVTSDGDALWLACFSSDPDSEHGDPICQVNPGDAWADMVTKVDAHDCENHQ